MTLDGLPQQFAEFVERASAALSREVTAAKNIAAAAKDETATAQAALAGLETQCKSVQSQLDALNDELQRRTTLAGLNREIATARKALAMLQADTAEATKALDKLAKERTAREAQLVALGNEANRMLGIRAEAEAVYADIKARVYSVQLGQRP
jgi:chromosome segregation ATPase